MTLSISVTRLQRRWAVHVAGLLTRSALPRWRQWAWFLALFLAVFSGKTSAQAVVYYYTDPQGTPLATADSTGNLLSIVDYKPYGSQVLGTPANGPGYTGHVNDSDSGLVYMQARYYDPSTTRFLSTDPSAPKAGSLLSFSRFTYAAGNPVVNVDADGRVVTSINPSNNAALAAYINQRANGTYAFVDNNLVRTGDSTNAGTSTYYATRLDGVIASPTVMTLDIGKLITREDSTVEDITANAGATDQWSDGNVHVTITGESNSFARNMSGSPLFATPGDVLQHEIVGHAAPMILGPDTGNAVDNENKARKEEGVDLRARDPSHTESRLIDRCGILCAH